MSGGFRLLSILFLVGVAALAVLADDVSVKSSPAKPPLAPQKLVEDIVQGHKITDAYRWLENAASPETQQWVSDEMAYTRSVLDPLPGRHQLHKRLTDLLSIGTISAPQIGGKHYFYTKREGSQNQPVLFVREGVNGKDRVLVDVNQLAADGTVALDWWVPSDHGKYVACGTSPTGSDITPLHRLEPATRQLLPSSIHRTSSCSL